MSERLCTTFKRPLIPVSGNLYMTSTSSFCKLKKKSLYCPTFTQIWVHITNITDNNYIPTLWIFFICVFKFPLKLTLCPQISQEYGFSEAWICLCLLRSELVLKVDSQPTELQENGVSPSKKNINKAKTYKNNFFKQNVKSSIYDLF